MRWSVASTTASKIAQKVGNFVDAAERQSQEEYEQPIKNA